LYADICDEMLELYGGGKKKEKNEASDESNSSNQSSPLTSSSPPTKKRVSQIFSVNILLANTVHFSLRILSDV